MKSPFQSIRPAAALLAASFLGLCLVLTGCGGATPQNNCELSGKVTYKGTPLTGGTIHFQSEDLKPAEEGGLVGATEIEPDGTYVARSLFPGKMMVSIDVPANSMDPSKMMSKAPPQDKPADQPMPGGYGKKAALLPIPKKYASPTTSKLEIDIQKGKNTKNWELTD